MNEKRKKILIIGGGSLLGSALAKVFTISPNTEVIFTYCNQPFDRAIFLDITNVNQCQRSISQLDPNCVILVAARTDVDYCELNQNDSFRTNVEGVHNVVKACSGRKLVYFSTDSIFDGAKGNYRENDLANPINYYSKTKFCGELATQSLDDHLILRICMLYSHTIDYPKFINWLIRSLSKKTMVSVATDLYSTPTFIDDIAKATFELVQNNLRGIFHVAGASSHSCYEMAGLISSIYGFDKQLITPVTAKELKRTALRPKYSTLNIQKLNDQGISMNNFQDGMSLIRNRITI